jgi:hypothetical protein
MVSILSPSTKGLLLPIHTYISVSNATLFCIYSSSLLHVSAVTGHHQAVVYLVKTGTLYFPLYLKLISSNLKYVNVILFVVIRSCIIECILCRGNVFTSCSLATIGGIHIQTHRLMGEIYDVRR